MVLHLHVRVARAGGVLDEGDLIWGFDYNITNYNLRKKTLIC